MYCTKCGKEFEENAIGCQSCDGLDKNYDNANKTKNRKILIGSICGVVAIALTIILLLTLNGGGYEELVDKYINVNYYGSWEESDIRPLAPGIMWEDWVDSDEGSIEAMFENWEKNNEDYYEIYNEKYDVDISYEIAHEVEISERELMEICEELEDRYDAIYPEITEGYAFKLKISGSILDKETMKNDKVDDTVKLTAIKMQGEWYLIVTNENRWLVDVIF